MKILVINPTFKSGLSQYTYFFCKALDEKGLDFVLLTTRGENEIDFFKPKFKVYKDLYQINQGSYLANAWYYGKNKNIIRKIVDEYRPDVIHFQGLLKPDGDDEFIEYLQNRGNKKIKIVYTAHYILPYEASLKHKQIYSRIYNKVNQIIVHAEQNKDELAAGFGVPREIITVIPYGNLIEIAQKSPELNLFEARSLLGLEKDDFCLLFFGAIRDYRGLDVLLKSMLYLKEHPKIKLMVVGEMQQKSICNDLIDVLKIRNAVSFYLEYIPIKYIGQYFYASNLVVLPYKKIYQSIAVQLAFAFNRPVLSTNVGGIAEVIENDKNGWLVQPNNPKALAEKILELYKQPRQEINQVGQTAYQIAKQKYTWEETAKKTLIVYKK